MTQSSTGNPPVWMGLIGGLRVWCSRSEDSAASLMEEQFVNADLEALIEKARRIRMSDVQLREQRLSFVYGNTHIENPLITREMVEEADRKVTQEEAAQK